MQHEAKFSILFRHWLKANPMKNCTFEVKDTRGKTYFPLNEWKEHQRVYAFAIRDKKKGVLIRIKGGNGEPDYAYYRGAMSWVVINFPHEFHIIGSYLLNNEKQTKLSIERSREIAYTIIKTRHEK